MLNCRVHRFAALIFCTMVMLVTTAKGAEQNSDDEAGRLVQFERDIVPLFRDHCLKCHGDDEAKADFRIDDRDSVFSYVEPGDLEASSLYTDYLITTDEESLMPPAAENDPLSSAQLALVRVWIEEGADWPEGAAVGTVTSEEPAPPSKEPETLLERAWAFQGFFHPATVHFPIALLSLGGLFVILGLKWPSIGTQVPLSCLLLGAVSAVVASLMGWAFAVQEGYVSLFDMEKDIFWHRWVGVGTSALSMFLAIVALIGIRRQSAGLNKIWKAGLVVLAMLIGLVGHQGGELKYGSDFYQKAFEKLLGEPALEPNPEPVALKDPDDKTLSW